MAAAKKSITKQEREFEIYRRFYRDVKKNEEWNEGMELVRGLREALKDVRKELRGLGKV